MKYTTAQQMLTADYPLLRRIAIYCLDLDLKFSWITSYDEHDFAIIFKEKDINISFYPLGAHSKEYQVWLYNFQYNCDEKREGITKSWNLGVYQYETTFNLLQKIKTGLDLRVYENTAL